MPIQKRAKEITQAETPEPQVAIILSLIEISWLEKIKFISSRDFKKPCELTKSDEGRLLELGMCPDGNPGLGYLASPVNRL